MKQSRGLDPACRTLPLREYSLMRQTSCWMSRGNAPASCLTVLRTTL